MAGDWIKLEHATPDKPEIVQMAAILGIDQDAVFGKVMRVWIWADQQSVDGNNIPITVQFLDRITLAQGFADALRRVGWLEGSDGSLSIPNFDRHNTQSAKDRSITNRAVSAFRDREKGNPVKQVFPRGLKRKIKERDNHTCVYCGRPEGKYYPPETKGDAYMCLDHVIPESRGGETNESNLVCACTKCNRAKSNRTPEEAGMKWPAITGLLQKPLPEKRREENIKVKTTSLPPLPPEGEAPAAKIGKLDDLVLPAALDTEAFRAALAKWKRHRTEIKKPLKPTMLAAQLAQCAEWGEQRAIAAINHTVAMGWQGLREPDLPMPSDRRNYGGSNRPQRNATEPDYSKGF